MLRTLGAQVRLAGEVLENAAYSVGHPRGLPAVAAFRPAKTDYQTETQEWLFDKGVALKQSQDYNAVLEVPTKFAAPSAKVAAEAKVADGSGVWYHANASGSVSLGEGTCVLEHAVVEGAKNKPTVLGAGVIVFPRSRVGAGVSIGDRSVIKAGAVLEEDVTVAEDAVVNQGAVVTKGSKVGAGELWAGNPAAKVGTVEASMKSSLAEIAQALTAMGLYNQVEHNKDIFEIHYERQALKDRKVWAEDFIEDHNNSPQGHLPVYLNMDHFPDVHPERRGLLYNKGEDKGPEGNVKQAYPQ